MKQLTDYKAFLFDWDGTLGRTLEVAIDIVYENSRHFDVQITRKDVIEHLGDWKTPFYFGLPEDKIDEFINMTKQAMQEKLSTAGLYEGVVELLETARKNNIKTALITSSFRDVIDLALAHNKLTELFDIILTASDVTEHKPHPEGIQSALKTLKIDPQDALMLGDSVKDLGAANNAGIDSLLFYPKEHEIIYDRASLDAFKPTHTFHSWDEVRHSLSSN